MILAGLNGFLAVALGAFGAHGLKGFLEGKEDAVQRLDWWTTAAHYHLTHALALAAIAFIASRTTSGLAKISGWGFQLGIVLFSGSLYVMTLTGIRILGAVTPLGGLGLLVGWLCLLLAARKLPTNE
jgi:uncharacterized membrane protein YgdD (TMEM256/DUF423 family)